MHSLFTLVSSLFILVTFASALRFTEAAAAAAPPPFLPFESSSSSSSSSPHLLFHLFLDSISTSSYQLITHIHHPLLHSFTSLGSNEFVPFQSETYQNYSNIELPAESEEPHTVFVNLQPSLENRREQAFFGFITHDQNGLERSCIIGVAVVGEEKEEEEGEEEKEVKVHTVLQDGLTCYVPEKEVRYDEQQEGNALIHQLPLVVLVDDAPEAKCGWNEKELKCSTRVEEIEEIEEIEEVEEEAEEGIIEAVEEEVEEEENELQEESEAKESEEQSEKEEALSADFSDGDSDVADSDSVLFATARVRPRKAPVQRSARVRKPVRKAPRAHKAPARAHKAVAHSRKAAAHKASARSRKGSVRATKGVTKAHAKGTFSTPKKGSAASALRRVQQNEGRPRPSAAKRCFQAVCNKVKAGYKKAGGTPGVGKWVGGTLGGVAGSAAGAHVAGPVGAAFGGQAGCYVGGKIGYCAGKGVDKAIGKMRKK